ncbi:MAG: cysteine--tRNA ligase [Gammaproteobacteria bacterium CG_4_10_14_0_8_um_filter_38_16]|nr:MAG: cysteine--tRNA ligase [Gammaproteobacteria bacterium CG_4_10_14_0_8_um_filter_38_16]PJA03351.1 MAG: cysteine--tRNA ligase [Gammaproteobacteria bacterium CG_4_10_14_0_2_um_filter_38_22]PJB10665.1 MAG: cysteine--tRNA ligase [Gammaproteobacteria bacterium CG_4_9_14_3_um_filter_38_9]
MRIFDSLTNVKKEFKPIVPGEIKLYVCGQTVYDYCHIGHARSMLAFDMIVRYWRSQDYKVTLVRNITDIDDKIIKRANENNESCESLTKRFIEIMHEDEKALGLTPVDVEPRATAFIKSIIELIQKLVDEKVAYIAGNGDVCFSVRQFKAYGKLSKRDIEKLISGARIDVAEGKKDPLDFVLWKLAKSNEPQWESPWGLGRPGWHIECSAMAATILGQPFDIHGGGMDLKFPHHENEIAQSECAYHKPFAYYWMHVGLLNVEGEKMSKSLNNFFTIRDVLVKYSVEVVRYFMLSAHYRSPVDYSENNMEKATQSLTRLYTAIRGLHLDDAVLFIAPPEFINAMNDDFNSSVAFSVLFEMARNINQLKEAGDIKKATLLASQLKKLGGIFGILQNDPELFLRGHVDANFSAQVEKLILQRNEARKNKNFKEADRLRDELKKRQVVIEDADGKTTWRIDR